MSVSVEFDLYANEFDPEVRSTNSANLIILEYSFEWYSMTFSQKALASNIR